MYVIRANNLIKYGRNYTSDYGKEAKQLRTSIRIPHGIILMFKDVHEKVEKVICIKGK